MKLEISDNFGKKQRTGFSSMSAQPEHRLVGPLDDLPWHDLECQSSHSLGQPPEPAPEHSPEHPHVALKVQTQHTTSAKKDRNIKKLTISIVPPSCVHTPNRLMTLPLELRELVYHELLSDRPLLFPSDPAKTFREYLFDMELVRLRQGRRVARLHPHRHLLNAAYRRTPILSWRNVRQHTGSLIGLLLTNREISSEFLFYASRFELFGFDINSSNCFKPGFWDISTLTVSNIRHCQLTVRCEDILQAKLAWSDTPDSPSSLLDTVLNFVKGTLAQMACLTEISFHFVDCITISHFIQELQKAEGSSDPMTLAEDMAKFLMQLPKMRSIDLCMRSRPECLPFPCATVVPVILWQLRNVKGQWKVAAGNEMPMRFLGSP